MPVVHGLRGEDIVCAVIRTGTDSQATKAATTTCATFITLACISTVPRAVRIAPGGRT
jgi:hypothetical protein